jgi:hypothetical protein
MLRLSEFGDIGLGLSIYSREFFIELTAVHDAMRSTTKGYFGLNIGAMADLMEDTLRITDACLKRRL